MALKKADIDKVKEVYLKLFDEPAEKVGSAIDPKHPLFKGIAARNKNGSSLWCVNHPLYAYSLVTHYGGKLFDLFNEDERKEFRELVAEDFEDIMSEADSLDEILEGIRKPYWFQFVYLCKDCLAKKAFTSLFGFYFNTALNDGNIGYKHIEIKKLAECFEACDLKQLLSAEDYHVFHNLKDEITVYKGIFPKEDSKFYNTNTLSSIDWTLNFYYAYWSVARHKVGGIVYKAKIKKEYALVFTGLHGTEDLIIDPEHLEDVKEFKEVPAFNTSTAKKATAPGKEKK